METKEITTPAGKVKVVLKAFITGRDMRALKDIYLKVGKVDATGTTITDIDPEMANQAENKSLELVVQSVNGEAEGVVEKILDMPSEDYTFIMEAVNEVAGFAKKK